MVTAQSFASTSSIPSSASGQSLTCGIEIVRPEGNPKAVAHDEPQIEAAGILNPDFFDPAL